jgi:glycosyltransferase involved in cell wall biosynthesis
MKPHSGRRTIAFVSNNSWSLYNYRLEVIRSLLADGHRVMVMAPQDEYSGLLTDEGCEFFPLDFNNRYENPFVDLVFYYRLKKAYRQIKPDLIFHFVAKPNIYGSLAAGALGIPSVAVITGLGYAFARKNWLYWVILNLYQFALRKASEVWFLNNEDAKVFISQKIIGIDKVKVLPGEGVDTNYFRPQGVKTSRGTFTFLMSSRLLKSKGIGIYADAARILKKKNFDFRCVLIGAREIHHPDAIRQEELEQWVREGLLDYQGFHKDVRPFLSRADCFVFPSYYNEGVPRSLMEAASMELPVITSHNRGCKEVVQHRTSGYLTRMHDPFDLADKMEQMMSLPDEERRYMGQQGRALVIRKFEMQKVVETYRETIGLLLGEAD